MDKLVCILLEEKDQIYFFNTVFLGTGIVHGML
jgi:hypothetical protein